MIRAVQIRDLTLGDGSPKICIPLVARSYDELTGILPVSRDIPFDLVEFRADYYTPLQELCFSAAQGSSVSLRQTLEAILRMIRGAIADKPLLFTVRTVAEGGKISLSYAEYEILLTCAARTGYVDLIDVELFTAGDKAAYLTKSLQKRGVRVIGSSHDFHKTPPRKKMLERLLTMQSLGMDITKLAVMPVSRKDVLNLMQVSCEMADGLADRPFVTMSMGKLGTISRISGSLTGSAITFAGAGEVSAPGQLHACAVRRILDELAAGADEPREEAEQGEAM